MAVDPKEIARATKMSKHLTFGQVEEEKLAAEAHLFRKELWRAYDNFGSFHLFFPNDPGIYCIFMGDILVYAGETRDLRKRMYQLSFSALHTFRRSLGSYQFKDDPDFKPYRKPGFPLPIETKLSLYMTKAIKVSHLVVRYGRMEIEEFLIDKHQPVYNTKGRTFI